MDDLESKMKDKLLEGLIEHMQGRMGDDLSTRLKPMEVSVAAPDADSLAEGLDHAKKLTEGGDMPAADGDESDDDRLMAAFGDGDDDEDDKGR